MSDKFHEELMEMYGNFQRMWNWLAGDPRRSKVDWPEWEHNDGKVPLAYHLCFPCQWAQNASRYMSLYALDVPAICKFCPVVWPTDNGRCEGDKPKSAWDCWRTGGHLSIHARQIANLPLLPELVE